MIVYREHEQASTPEECISRIFSDLNRVEENSAHEAAMELLINWGEFESAIEDAISPEKDYLNLLNKNLRAAGIFAGHIFRASWERKSDEVKTWAGRLKFALDEISVMKLPVEIKVKKPEGFVHYGLYPETYMEAAKKFYKDMRPAKAAVIGLRSIGTSLSAVVAATLESLGCAVQAFTVRPHGHPFDRKVEISQEFEKELLRSGFDLFAVVDEGPGLSGSSITGMADRLSLAGIPDSRIILFPSWSPDGDNFKSEKARTRWKKHAKYTASFEDLWIKTGRLAENLPSAGLMDISAGGWRAFFYANESDSPAVHPNHEKRKYFCSDNKVPLLLRFIGHGRYGREKFERAKALAKAGFAQPVVGLSNGFLLAEFVNGRPISRNEVNPLMLDFMAEYLKFLRTNFVVERQTGFENIREMMEVNISLGLGEEWADKLGFLDRFASIMDESPAVAIDGHMMPNDWLLTYNGYVKTDCIDHYADQFFPCAQDIAWDLAGAITEFNLNPMQQEYLISKYQAVTGDDVRRRIVFYSMAYLAYRLGYCVFAADELEPTLDGRKFRAMSGDYSARLKQQISRFAADTSVARARARG
ncbi:MAG: hypothetical protein HYS21_12125 [Deltaproteobacteria bacterium]|nr:hypothetical protein [Deltaproteobacteria bacterium]